MSKKSSGAPVIADADNNNNNGYDQPTYDSLVESATKARKSYSNDPLKRLDVSYILTHNKNQEPGWIRRIIPPHIVPQQNPFQDRRADLRILLVDFFQAWFRKLEQVVDVLFWNRGKGAEEDHK
jgi:hypothetical protein